MTRDQPVLIAGAGIAGLSVAIALAAQGRQVRVLERRTEPGEAGAGIQIGPNGTRVLHRLGVLDRLATDLAEPDALQVRDGPSGRVLIEMPLGETIEERHGTPYIVAHRADLHAALLAEAGARPAIQISYGIAVQSATTHGDGVIAMTSDGVEHRGSALIGADGLRSQVRRQIGPEARLAFSGYSAARAVISSALLPESLPRRNVGLWLAPGAHVVHYPVRHGDDTAFVVVGRDTWSEEGWGTQIEPREVAARIQAFSEPIRSAVCRCSQWRKWALYRETVAPPLVAGRIALVGDAAHPVVPFLAQGAVLALEDAVTLADCLAETGADVPAGLALYASRRRARTRRVQQASERNGRVYHMGGPLAAARNIAMRALGGDRLLARWDWLYGWRDGARAGVAATG
ncbi:MAG: FAD-dependent monooxygenase [Hyphomicrobiaceae bacterium]